MSGIKCAVCGCDCVTQNESDGYFEAGSFCSHCRSTICDDHINIKGICFDCVKRLEERDLFNHPAPAPPGGPDTVNHPAHYTQGKIEVIDFIEDQRLNENYYLANVIKYVCRARHKGKYLEDLRKAAWYLEREIRRMKADDVGEDNA